METIDYRNTPVTLDVAKRDLIALRRNNSGSGNPRDINGTYFGDEWTDGRWKYPRVYVGWEQTRHYWENKALSGKIADREIRVLFPRIKPVE